MPESTDADGTSRTIKRLTVAVWILALICVLNLSVALYAVWYPSYILSRFTSTLPEALATKGLPPLEEPRFDLLPLDTRLQAASVIALTRFEKDGNKLRSVITELLKQSPGTTFYYKVGDEYAEGSRYLHNGTEFGDGQLIFFVGSPASMRESMSISDDRIPGFGDMPIAVLREMIAGQPK